MNQVLTLWSRPLKRGTDHNPQLVVGAVLLATLLVVAVFAPLIAPYGPWQIANKSHLPPFSPGHLLGTDMLGRDVLSGVIYGARISLLIGITAAAAGICIGTVVGGIAGYSGGWIDDLLMRCTEFLQTMPGFVLSLVLLAVLGPAIWSVVLAIALVSWPSVARLMRGEFKALRSREFVMASVVLGESHARIVWSHMLPNALGPVISIASLKVAAAILMESTLSFLGLGDVDQMSWGLMIGMSRALLRTAWWMSVFPGVALFLTVLALTLISDGLGRKLGGRRQSML
jgi:peptide/nickel transport system permease protein